MANSNEAGGEPALVNDTDATTTDNTADDDDLDLLPTANTTSFDAQTPYQILLLTQPPSGIAWYNFCRAHSIDTGAAHLLSREVQKNGVAILGTWPRDEAREIERVLRDEIGMDDAKKSVRCIPAPLEGSGVVRVVPKDKDNNSGGSASASGGEPDKKAKTVASSSSPDQNKVHPEIQRLYDEGIITSAEFEQMRQADRLFEAEVEAAPTTFAVQKFPSANHQQHLPPAIKFDYNHGRRPDVYDAYAHRHNPRFWVNHRLYQANAATLDAVCLVEFCRKYTVPKKGPSEGKIKYHRRGVITKKLQFHPEYSSDPNFEGGRDYGKYCRFALVRYRPWVDAPFGRVESAGGAGGGDDGGDAKQVEYKPEEDECIRQWAQYLLELRERMHLVPDVLLPEELKGGGAGIELLVVPEVEGADEVERSMDMSAIDMGEDEKKVDEEIGGGGGAAIQTLDDVIRAAEEAIGRDTNADAALVSDDDDDEEEDNEGDDNDDAAKVDEEVEDDVLPSSFTDMGEEADAVDKETFPFDDAPANIAGEDAAEDDDGDNPFASFVSNKMSGDADDVADEDNWLSSAMAAGAVAVDAAAAERTAKEEVDATAAEADTADAEEDLAADDASLDSIGKMFDDAKKRLSDVMSVPSDAESDEASEVASIAASDGSSQIEEMHNDFSTDSADFTRKESDDNMAREEIDLAASISFVKEELDEIDAEAEATAAAVLFQSSWRGHSARKSVSVSADNEPTSELEVETEVEIKGDAKAPVATPEKVAAVATPSALTLKLEQSAANSPTKAEGSASIASASTSPRSKTRAPESLPFLAENSSSNFVSPRERELQELRDLVKGRATEGKERLESYAGQYSDEQSRIEELRSQADADQHKVNEIHRQAKKIKTTSSALLIQSAWRRHKAQEAFIQHRDAVREKNAQEEAAAAVVIQTAARGYNERQRYVALLQGCVALQAIARGSQTRAIHSTKEAEPNVEDFHDSATAEHCDTNLTDEYCPSNASVGDYFTAAEDEDVRVARKNKTVGAGKKLFGKRKSSKAKGYAVMMASDSESDDEMGEIRQSTSFLGRKSLKADAYYAEMLVDDYASESDVETTTSSPTRSSRSASPLKRRVKKVQDKEKDGRRKSVVGSLLRKGKGGKKKKSVVADIVDDEDTTGSVLLSARVPKTKPTPKPKAKKARRKKNKTRGVRETGPEEPKFWQGFAVDMEESDIESDLEDDAGSIHSSMQRHSAPQIFYCRTIEEESFDEEEDFFASTTPRAQVDLSKDAVPENATTVTTEEFSNYVSNRFEFPEEPLVFNPNNHWQKVGGERASSANGDDNANDDAEKPAGAEVEASAEDEAVEVTLPVDKDKVVDENAPADNIDEESAFGAGRSIASAVTLKASASLFIDDDNNAAPETTATSRSVPAKAAPVADNGPGPLTQAAVMDSASIFPMENFCWDAAFPDEKDPSSAENAAKFDTPENTDVIATNASDEIKVLVGDSPREVSAGDILVDLETTLKDEDVSVAVSTASGKTRLKSLRRTKKKTKTTKKSKAAVQSSGIDGESLLSTESSSAMNFGQIVPEEEDDPSGTPANVSIDTSFDDGVEISMDSIEPIAQASMAPSTSSTAKSTKDPAPVPTPALAPPTTNIIADDEEDMPVIAPSTITATRFRVRSLGRNYKAMDDVQL